jgi:predicted amidohydrolase YtcJ
MKGLSNMNSITRRDFFKVAGLGAGAVALTGMAGCSSSSNSNKSSSSAVADTVVYGKIYTSNKNRDYVQALAVKDGKYLYVGNEDGVKEYVKDGTTKVVDYRNKGLVMAGATEGHGHYAGQGMLTHLNVAVSGSTEDEILANVKKYVEDNPDKEFYYTFGWDNVAMLDTKTKIDMKTKLDSICADKIMVIVDNSGHNAFCNTKAFEEAGVTTETSVDGGTFHKTESGQLSGLVEDLAFNYILKKSVATKPFILESDYEGICKSMQDTLHSYGYTYYQDGWLNYFSDQLVQCLSDYDKKHGLTIIASGSHKIDSFDDWESEISKAEEYMGKYPTDHLKYNVIKLFADGESVEGGSGWLIDGYADGSHGTQVWKDDVINSITKAANKKGLSIHVHSQGDAATQQVVNACIEAESVKASGVYNGICHGRNITEDSKKKMGEHNIYAAENINWRTLSSQEAVNKIADQINITSDEEGAVVAMVEATALAGYPIKSLLNAGINVSSSTDVPAASGAPVTVCGIMEVAVNDTRPDMNVWQLDPAERVSIEEAMDIMTINGARQLMCETERGSIETGKYADFLLINKDVTSCDPDKIHEGEVESVYFEGKEVYTK